MAFSLRASHFTPRRSVGTDRPADSQVKHGTDVRTPQTVSPRARALCVSVWDRFSLFVLLSV